jgi:methyltransferase
VQSLWVFLAFLGLVAILRIVELVVSRRRQGERAAVPEPALFPLMVLLHVGLIVLPAAEAWGLSRPLIPALALGAGAVLLLATCLRVWTLKTLGVSWNVRVVVPGEEGIVTTGPYAWIRHPNYLVVILEIAAIPLLHTAWWSALGLTLLNAFVLWRRIKVEEAALNEVAAWREAMAGKARLIPGVL